MKRQRLEWIDGLRGLAVLMVVIFHAWLFTGINPLLPRNAGGPTIVLASLGPWGVSLFLVLSGFCLAYAPLRRQADGQVDWFTLRSFVISRSRRILPPYYVTLVLFSALALYFQSQGIMIPSLRAPSIPDAVAHLTLVHNNFTQFAQTIDSPFWSLGLEWQWYWLFPVLLVACLRWPRRTLVACVLTALVWTAMSHAWTALSFDQMLPGRLGEFCCGILAARLLVAERRVNSAMLAVIAAACLAAVALLPLSLIFVGAYYPLCGIGFAALLLLASQHATFNRMASWRPLVFVGEISYSLYLAHYPLMGAIEAWLHFGLHVPALVTMGVGALAVMPFGWSLYILCERPFMRRTVPTRPIAIATASP